MAVGTNNKNNQHLGIAYKTLQDGFLKVEWNVIKYLKVLVWLLFIDMDPINYQILMTTLPSKYLII